MKPLYTITISIFLCLTLTACEPPAGTKAQTVQETSASSPDSATVTPDPIPDVTDNSQTPAVSEVSETQEVYVNEFTGRHNVRGLDTLEQMERVFQGMEGKRLRYADLIA